MKTRKLMAMAMASAMALPTCTAFADSAEEPVKLTGLFIAHPLTKSVDDMQWLQEIEEKAGVEIEWEQIYTDWDQTKSTRFASGDIPDILINATADSDYATYKGLFMELTDLIDQLAQTYRQCRGRAIHLHLQRLMRVRFTHCRSSRASGRIATVYGH